MTTILAVGNPDQFIQVSDRRLTSTVDGTVVDDESNKAILFLPQDGRLAGGYSGIATLGDFRTRDWILDALYDCALPDFLAENSLKRFTERASEDFNSLPSLKKIPHARKRLSILFSGYLYGFEPPVPIQVLISNHLQPGLTVTSRDQAEFKIYFNQVLDPTAEHFVIKHEIGARLRMSVHDRNTLQMLVHTRKPASAILDKLIEVFRKFASAPESYGVVGKQLSSIIIPRQRDATMLFDYHSETVKPESYSHDTVYARPDGRWVLRDVKIEPVDLGNTPPLSKPKPRRNDPCWCGSGKKYKRCHAKEDAQRVPWGITFGPANPTEANGNA